MLTEEQWQQIREATERVMAREASYQAIDERRPYDPATYTQHKTPVRVGRDHCSGPSRGGIAIILEHVDD